jgi:hypothetical protein
VRINEELLDGKVAAVVSQGCSWDSLVERADNLRVVGIVESLQN